MNKTLLQMSLAFSLLLFILNYEFFYINAEGIFIISFLLFTLCFYYFAGDLIGELLDASSIEITKKIKEVSALQRGSLEENKKLVNQLQTMQSKILPLFVLTVAVIETREDLIINLQKKSYRNFLEKKLKTLLLELTLINTSFAQKAGKEIMDLYEKKIRNKKK